MKKFIKLSAVIFAATALTVACDEELGNQNIETEERLSEYVLDVQRNAVYLYNILDEGLRSSDFANDDSVFVDQVLVKKIDGNKVLLDFGIGVQGNDGVTRSGDITLNVTGDYKLQGATISGGFTNYMADDKPYGGSMLLTTKAGTEFDLELTDFSINNEFEADLDQTLIWTNGYATPDDDSDDAYTLSGDFDGIDLISKDTVNAVVTSPFNYDKACQFGMVSGSMNINLNGPNVTYGSGSVDFIDADGCLDLFEIVVTDGEEEVTAIRSFKGF